MTTSIQAGCNVLDANTEAFLVCLSDMPKLEPMHYNALISKFKKEKTSDNSPIIRPVFKEKFGHPIIFDINLKQDILDCKAADGCKSVLNSQKENLLNWTLGNSAYYADVDTKMDYYKL